jgi:hypothetical protein
MAHAMVAVWLARIDAARPAYPTVHAPAEIAILNARTISTQSGPSSSNSRVAPGDSNVSADGPEPPANRMQATMSGFAKPAAAAKPKPVEPHRPSPGPSRKATSRVAAAADPASASVSAAEIASAAEAASAPEAAGLNAAASGAAALAGASETSSAPQAGQPTAASKPSAGGAAHGPSASAGAAGVSSGAIANKDPGEKFSLPPSVDLQFDSFYNGVQNQVGTLHWQTDGHHYLMVVSIPLPFVGLFSFTSEGGIDKYGLAPDRYAEQRGRRAPDETRMERNATPPRISFTRTTETLPLPEPVEDRLSMMMQLAALVRGDPSRYQPGVTRQFAVVDNNSGEVWAIETIGQETVQTRVGPVEALHFMRLARRADDRRRLDIWLSESLGWLPARIMQTEPNGSQIELVWRGAPK